MAVAVSITVGGGLFVSVGESVAAFVGLVVGMAVLGAFGVLVAGCVVVGESVAVFVGLGVGVAALGAVGAIVGVSEGVLMAVFVGDGVAVAKMGSVIRVISLHRPLNSYR